MKHSGTISLFSVQTQSSQPPWSALASVATHLLAIALVWAGFIGQPRIKEQPLAQRYTLRKVELHQPDMQARRSAQCASGHASRGKSELAQNTTPRPARQSSMRPVAHLKIARQTLIQPNLPKEVEAKIDIPVPTVVIWSPERVKVTAIVPPPQPQPVAANVKPSVAPPTEEVNLADVAMASTTFAAQNQPIVASTTSPLAIVGTTQVMEPPVTPTNSNAQPTPTAVLSLSDLRVKDGEVTLPPANESAPASSQGALTPGQPNDTASGTANGLAAGKDGAEAKAAQPDSTAASGNALNQSGAAAGAPMGGETGANAGSSQQITLPKDGNFGVVVVGSALGDKYPESAELWGGRMAYTVYLHVGLAKSWILQYSLPRVADAAAGGNSARLEAPWPYNIVRPNLAPGSINADALMVHGIVNAAGKFEALAVVFPQPFAEAAFVLNSLAQWQFRPATMSGQTTPVEILLIIPDVE